MGSVGTIAVGAGAGFMVGKALGAGLLGTVLGAVLSAVVFKDKPMAVMVMPEMELTGGGGMSGFNASPSNRAFMGRR